MIRVAKEAGPNVLSKFQLFNAEDDKGKPHYEWVKAHELTFEQAKELFDYGASIGQEVFFSVFAPEYVEWCERIGIEHIKVSASTFDLRVIRAVVDSRIWYISSLDSKYFQSIRNGDSFLCCPNGYPQKWGYNMPDFAKIDGISDHVIGLDIAKIAFARGAQIVEKHFCLEHSPEFPDDKWSMTPDELKELVRWERVCKEFLG